MTWRLWPRRWTRKTKSEKPQGRHRRRLDPYRRPLHQQRSDDDIAAQWLRGDYGKPSEENDQHE